MIGQLFRRYKYNINVGFSGTAGSGENEVQRVRRLRPRSEPVAPLPEVPLLSRPSFFEQSSQYHVGGSGFATFTQGRWN